MNEASHLLARAKRGRRSAAFHVVTRGADAMSDRPPGDPVRRALCWAAGLTLALAVLAALVALGVTQAIDGWVLRAVGAIGSYPLDVAASLFAILGQSEVTGPLALVLAFVWWRRRGIRGLVPLLLFAGVAIEAVLKHFVAHPAPPIELSRAIEFLPQLGPTSPYSFPSGHMFRAVFLAALVLEQPIFWVIFGTMAFTVLYLAEHWASDVAGGALAGLLLAGLAAAIVGGGRQRRRRR